MLDEIYQISGNTHTSKDVRIVAHDAEVCAMFVTGIARRMTAGVKAAQKLDGAGDHDSAATVLDVILDAAWHDVSNLENLLRPNIQPMHERILAFGKVQSGAPYRDRFPRLNDGYDDYNSVNR